MSWIWARDDAWNMERLGLELEALVERDDKGNEISDRGEDHPWRRWIRGESRFDLDAQMQVPTVLVSKDRPELTVTIREYLEGDPTIFVIKPLGARVANRARSRAEDPGDDGLFDAIAHGLASIRHGEDGPPLELERDEAGVLTDEALKVLWYADKRQGASLVTSLGWALLTLQPPMGSAEKKR